MDINLDWFNRLRIESILITELFKNGLHVLRLLKFEYCNLKEGSIDYLRQGDEIHLVLIEIS
jgi:hypothetical protein